MGGRKTDCKYTATEPSKNPKAVSNRQTATGVEFECNSGGGTSSNSLKNLEPLLKTLIQTQWGLCWDEQIQRFDKLEEKLDNHHMLKANTCLKCASCTIPLDSLKKLGILPSDPDPVQRLLEMQNELIRTRNELKETKEKLKKEKSELEQYKLGEVKAEAKKQKSQQTIKRLVSQLKQEKSNNEQLKCKIADRDEKIEEIEAKLVEQMWTADATNGYSDSNEHITLSSNDWKIGDTCWAPEFAPWKSEKVYCEAKIVSIDESGYDCVVKNIHEDGYYEGAIELEDDEWTVSLTDLISFNDMGNVHTEDDEDQYNYEYEENDWPGLNTLMDGNLE